MWVVVGCRGRPRALRAHSSADAVTVEVGEDQVVVRAVTVGDLRSMPVDGSPETLRSALLERCVIRATRAGKQISPRELPAATVDRIESTSMSWTRRRPRGRPHLRRLR
jgi:hypothetical protein